MKLNKVLYYKLYHYIKTNYDLAIIEKRIPLKENARGYYSRELYMKNIKIIIDPRYSYFEKIYTLLHEFGHYLADTNGRYVTMKVANWKHEYNAMCYGWQVIQKFKIPITRKEWINYHKKNSLELVNMI